VRWIVVVAAVEAAATSLILILSPSLFGWLILGAQLSEAGQALGRLIGIVLLAFGLACWPAPSAIQSTSAVRALLMSLSGFLATSSFMKSRNSRLRRRR
jgi:hypothetical protein